MVEQTDTTVTLHLLIGSNLFVQVFVSERSGRVSMALVSGQDRVYGWDLRHGDWHVHPYEDAARHEPMVEDVSTYTLLRFLARVEEILLSDDLI